MQGLMNFHDKNIKETYVLNDLKIFMKTPRIYNKVTLKITDRHSTQAFYTAFYILYYDLFPVVFVILSLATY